MILERQREGIAIAKAARVFKDESQRSRPVQVAEVSLKLVEAKARRETQAEVAKDFRSRETLRKYLHSN